MIILGIDIGWGIEVSKKGSSVVEFVFCVPVFVMFFYGTIFINDYFGKAEDIRIANRSIALSTEKDSRVLYEKFISKKENKDNELGYDDKNENEKDKDIFLVELKKERTQPKDFKEDKDNMDKTLEKGVGVIFKLFNKISSDDYKYYSSIYANEQKKEDTRESFSVYNHFLSKKNLEENNLFNLRYALSSELNSGYLNNKEFRNMGIVGMALGVNSSWSSDFVDDCLMNFGFSSECNGVNYFRTIVEGIAAAKTTADVMTFGTGAVVSRTVGIAVDAIINEGVDIIINNISRKIEEKVEEKMSEFEDIVIDES